jgi:hypothetical protein
MKKLMIIVCSLSCVSGMAQEKLFIKKYPGNENAVYITNSNVINGLAFIYQTAADTSKSVFFIEHFKPADIEFIEQKLHLHNAKICFENYKSKRGDFIYTFTSEHKLIYFFHKENKDSTPNKYN